MTYIKPNACSHLNGMTTQAFPSYDLEIIRDSTIRVPINLTNVKMYYKLHKQTALIRLHL